MQRVDLGRPLALKRRCNQLVKWQEICQHWPCASSSGRFSSISNTSTNNPNNFKRAYHLVEGKAGKTCQILPALSIIKIGGTGQPQGK